MRGDVASYDGADLMQQAEGGLVIVEIQYRLGVFGFLAAHELQAHGTANAGLRKPRHSFCSHRQLTPSS